MSVPQLQLVGETLGSYRVLSLIGQGGMGQVFLAEHPLIGKKAAIKVLLAQYSNDAEVVNRFFNEARSATLIRHPGIIEIFDFGQHSSGSAFIIMEFLEGESLADRLRRERPLPVELVVEIVRQLASALGAAHSKGIVHRDLKPDNIYLVPDSEMPHGIRVKVLDFGIAKLNLGMGAGGVSKTRTGMMMGTPLYMSPEQCRGAGNVDHRADIYSLGCMTFEMVSGAPPFVYDGPGEIIAAHIFSPPPTLSSVVPNVPAVLDKVVARALAKTTDQRYQSILEMSRELEPIANRVSGRMPVVSGSPPPILTPSQTNTPDARTHSPAAVNTTLQGAASEVSDHTMPDQRRSWKLPVALGVVLGVGAAGVLLFRGKSDAPPPTPAVVAPKVEAPKVEVPPEKSPEKAPEKIPDKPAAPEKVHLSIASEPAGAEVYRAADGVRVGVTPLAMDRTPSDGEIIFLLKLSGYGDERVVLSASEDGQREVKLRKKHTSTPPPPPKKKLKNGVLDPFGN